PGLAEQLHQCHLDLGVTGGAVAAMGPEGVGDEVGEAGGDLQQAGVPGAAVLGQGRLDQVTGAVQLVVVGEVRPAPLPAQLLVVDGVQVPVLVLGGGDPAGDSALQLEQLRVPGAADLV